MEDILPIHHPIQAEHHVLGCCSLPGYPMDFQIHSTILERPQLVRH